MVKSLSGSGVQACHTNDAATIAMLAIRLLRKKFIRIMLKQCSVKGY